MNMGFIVILVTTLCTQTFMLAESLESYESSNFKVEVTAGVAFVVFEYPPINLLDKKMLDNLDALAKELENDASVKVVVFQSNHPGFFLSHFDFTEVSQMSIAVPPGNLTYPQTVLQRISSLPQATIAKVEGMARGGGLDFMLACDMSFAAHGRATFMQMEIGLGIVPYGGATQRLPRVAGMGRTLEIILGAHDFDADLAEKYGVINRAFDSRADIRQFVEGLAFRIASFPSTSITACKRSVQSSELGLAEGLVEEANQFRKALNQEPEQLEDERVKYDVKSQEWQKNWDTNLMELNPKSEIYEE